MRILEVLTREHQLFGSLAQRLARAVEFDEQSARSEVRNILLLLLPGLDKHEEIEDLVFGHPYASEPGAGQILKAVEAQHRKIQSLRDDLSAALRDADRCPFAALRALVLELVERLKEHMTTEEQHLWPHYRHAASRSVNGSIARKADESVRALESDIHQRQLLLSEYLGRRR